MQFDKNDIKNILVVRNDRFGEFLLNIPAIRALKETFTLAKITLVIGPQTKELAENLNFVDKVIEWGIDKKCTLLGKIRFINFLAKQKFDLAVILNPSKEFNIFTYFAKIPIRVGYDRKCAFLLTHRLKDKKYLGQRHEVEYNLELVRVIGASTKNKSVAIETRPEDMEFVNGILSKYNISDNDRLVVIHPWTSDPVKQWPIEKFKELAHKLIQELHVKVMVIAGKEEEIRSEGFCSSIKGLVNLAGKTTLMQSAALLKRVELLVSNDSGPMHLAVSVGTPVVAIFRTDIAAKSARRWGPWGENCCIIERSKLNDISVEEVYDKVRRYVKKEKLLT